MSKKLKFVSATVENSAEKRENAGTKLWYQHFFLQCFQQASFYGKLKVGNVWYRIKKDTYHCLTLSQTTNFRLFQIERLCR